MLVNRQAVGAGVQVLSSAGIAFLFLPALDKAWAADPARPGPVGAQLRTGEKLYLGFVLAIGAGVSYSSGSWFPLAVAGALAAIVLLTYRKAYREKS
jgi:hypothetical protein